MKQIKMDPPQTCLRHEKYSCQLKTVCIHLKMTSTPSSAFKKQTNKTKHEIANA